LVAHIEVRGPLTQDLVVLDGQRLSVGKGSDADIPILSDSAVSRVHLVLERIGSTWFLRDMASRNGTYVNGDRLFGERPLRHGDEVRVGRTRLIYHDRRAARDPETDTIAGPPTLTAREHDALVELCRPLLQGHAFTQPASVREIAAAMVVTGAAVKQHLGHLYDKFGIEERAGDSRRVRLANEALSSGAVTIADIRSPSGP
jgi:predicted component of type VI protein secretion system